MGPLIGLNCSTIECTSLSPSAPIWQDVLAQAMTGELIAAMNYKSLSEICDDPEEVADALEHAEGERGYAAAFAAEGRKIGVEVQLRVASWFSLHFLSRNSYRWPCEAQPGTETWSSALGL